MSVAAKTFGTMAIVLAFILLSLSPFLFGFHALLYVALPLTFVMLGIILWLGSGRG